MAALSRKIGRILIALRVVTQKNSATPCPRYICGKCKKEIFGDAEIELDEFSDN